MCCFQVIGARRLSQLTMEIKEFRFEGNNNNNGIEDNGEFNYYAKLLVHRGDHDQIMLETDSMHMVKKVVRWNQKFELSASETCSSSSVGFKVFRSRKYLPDKLVGYAEGEVEPLFKLLLKEEADDDDDDHQQKSSQLKNILLQLEDHAESVGIFKGNKKKGSLCISLSLRYNNLTVIGGGSHGWSFAMRHEDFEMMPLPTHKTRKQTKPFATKLKQLVFCHA